MKTTSFVLKFLIIDVKYVLQFITLVKAVEKCNCTTIRFEHLFISKFNNDVLNFIHNKPLFAKKIVILPKGVANNMASYLNNKSYWPS